MTTQTRSIFGHLYWVCRPFNGTVARNKISIHRIPYDEHENLDFSDKSTTHLDNLILSEAYCVIRRISACNNYYLLYRLFRLWFVMRILHFLPHASSYVTFAIATDWIQLELIYPFTVALYFWNFNLVFHIKSTKEMLAYPGKHTNAFEDKKRCERVTVKQTRSGLQLLLTKIYNMNE